MTRLACLICALCCAACVADPLPPSDAGIGRADTGSDRGPNPPDGFVDVADLGFDFTVVDRGPPIDMAPPPLDMEPPPIDAALEVDEGPLGPEVPLPAHAEVAVTERAGETFFVWIDDAGDVRGLRVGVDGRPGAPEVLDSPEQRPERIVALAADGHPWVAYGSADGPVVAFEVDLPRRTRRVLDDLRGPPLLARAADGVLVIAESVDGALAWQRIDHDLTVEPVIVDTLGLEPPDDAAGISTGVVMAWSADEQCVQLDDLDWQPIGTFICRGGEVQLLSDGRKAVLSRVAPNDNDLVIALESLFDHDEDYPVSFFEQSSGVAFAKDGDERTVIGARTYDGSRRLLASVVGPDAAWDTIETWPDSDALPFRRTRAFARRTLPALAVAGQCPDGGACFGPDDCGREVCDGGVGAEHLLALEFREDGLPRVRRYPLTRRAIGVPPYNMPDTAGCLPRAERCDLVDQDCDERVDDGICCLGTANVNYRWSSVTPIARSMVDGELRYDVLFADVSTNNAYRLLYRFEGTDEWTGKSISLRQDQSGVPGNLGVRFTGAREGRFLISAGGITGLVARAVDEGGALGGWTLFMAHPSRREAGQDPPRPSVPLDCDEVLAADALQHDSPAAGNPDGEQLLIVCPDKIIQVFAIHEGRDIVTRFDRFQIPPVTWATIARNGRGRLQIMVGYPVAGEGLWAVRALAVDSAVPGPATSGMVPEQLSQIGPVDAAFPIYRHPTLTRPPIQIRPGPSARLAFTEFDRFGNPTTVWRSALLGPDPRRIAFSPTAFRLFAEGPAEPPEGFATATGWWAADVTGNLDSIDLWSTEPVFVTPGEAADWYATRGSYGVDDPNFSITRYDLIVLTATADDHTQWRAFTRETRCIRP